MLSILIDFPHMKERVVREHVIESNKVNIGEVLLKVDFDLIRNTELL